jgi:organic hydroperoxide reductase OsmC/OhrA
MAHQQHTYEVEVKWTGNTGAGTVSYTGYERAYELRSGDRKPPIFGSSEPAFRGDATRWNPEELLVGALASCHKLWYLHLCADAGVVVTEYVDRASGVMELGGGSGRFRQVVLRPRVTIAKGSDPALAARFHDDAHAKCFIAKSVNFEVQHQSEIVVEPD